MTKVLLVVLLEAYHYLTKVAWQTCKFGENERNNCRAAKVREIFINPMYCLSSPLTQSPLDTSTGKSLDSSHMDILFSKAVQKGLKMQVSSLVRD